MTESESKRKQKMVYTPKCHIPLGEAIMTETGECALRIKKPKSQEVEIVPIGLLLTDVAKVATEATT